MLSKRGKKQTKQKKPKKSTPANYKYYYLTKLGSKIVSAAGHSYLKRTQNVKLTS